MQRLYPLATVLSFILHLGAAAHAHGEPFQALPGMRVDPHSITVSGLSSGAFFAVQMHVAYSATIVGSGIFAGGIYGCAEGDVLKAQTQCMAAPSLVEVKKYVDHARHLAEEGRIDPVENLSSSRVYLFAGTRDFTVNPDESIKLHDFFSAFMDPFQMSFKNDIAAAHGQPTENFGNECDVSQPPWLQKCGYDGAGAALTHLYGNLRPPVKANSQHLYLFEQNLYAKSEAFMHRDGYIYIPGSCEHDRGGCRLHVAFHGCKQGPEYTDAYRVHSGYNEWAEANNIVILYPSAANSHNNPNGCWDWWGYTGTNYLTKTAPQISAVKSMIDALSSSAN